MKRLVSFSVAAMLAMGVTAGAAYQNTQVVGATYVVNGQVMSAEQFRELMDKCGIQTPEIPQFKPESKPETNPDTKPETDPDVKPDGGSGENTPSQSAFAAQVVSLVNAERAENGLPALKVDDKVSAAAQTRAAELKRSFSHSRPDGSSYSTALTEAGASYRGSGENIAYGQSSPQAVMNGWMNSSGHRANILSNKYTTIGVGYTVVDGVPYWTQLFTY